MNLSVDITRNHVFKDPKKLLSYTMVVGCGGLEDFKETWNNLT